MIFSPFWPRCSVRSAFMSATTLPCAKRRAWSSARAASTARSHRSSSSVSTTPSWPWTSKTARRPATSSTSRKTRGHLRPYSAGRTVLDLCCHTGGFSIHAALYGAARVQAVDVSETALAMVRGNAARNGVADRVETVCANVFDLVRPGLRGGQTVRPCHLRPARLCQEPQRPRRRVSGLSRAEPPLHAADGAGRASL